MGIESLTLRLLNKAIVSCLARVCNAVCCHQCLKYEKVLKHSEVVDGKEGRVRR
jgi:hypothetical protein